MPLPTDKTYPTAATDETWQKKKSVTDKLIKTKVGPALIIAKAKWGEIKFDDLDSSKTTKTISSAKAQLAKANSAWLKVVAARTALKNAWTLADTQAVNSKLSSTSRTALKAVSVALKAADDRLLKMDDIVPAFQIDLNNATKSAMAKWTNLEVKSGSKILANAKTAALASNGTYEAKDVDWKIPDRLAWEYLQKKVKVSAHDGNGENTEHEMTLAGANSNTLRLKP